MSDTEAQEAATQEGYSERLAVALETDWSGVLLPTRQKAAALLRSQAEQIEQLRAELARMREPLSAEALADKCEAFGITKTRARDD